MVTALAATATSDASPNIVLVLADDLGFGDVGFNDQPHIRTPNLDKMAREGIVLSQHYAGSTGCMPSLCALMTGKHTGHATVRGNPRWTASGKPVVLIPGDVTVAEELKRAGYRTGIIGKWGLAQVSDDAMPLCQGFEYFYGYRRHRAAHHYYPVELWRNNTHFTLAENSPKAKRGRYSHDLFLDEALRSITDDDGRPFFLFLSLTIPHKEITVPQSAKEPYLKLSWPERQMQSNRFYYNDAEGNVTYAGMVSRMDEGIGRIRHRLEELGLAEQTLILPSSDNGPEFDRKDGFFNSNGPLRGGKRDLYEGGIRVPTVAVWPGRIPAGSRSDHPAAFWDFLPTACELVGIEPTDPSIDGVSYLPSLLGEPERQEGPSTLYWELREKQALSKRFAVRTGN